MGPYAELFVQDTAKAGTDSGAAASKYGRTNGGMGRGV